MTKRLNKSISEYNEYKKGGWLSGLHLKKGLCTPMSKSTCTPRRKALARRFKSGDLSHAKGGSLLLYPLGVPPTMAVNFDEGGNLYFLGGMKPPSYGVQATGAIAGSLSGLMPKDTAGGGAVSGALEGASMGSMLGPYGMAAGALIGGTAGLISGKKAAREKREEEFNSEIKQRNSSLGIKAMGGKLTEFNNGGRHEENAIGGIPQGVAPDGQVNKVEEGETKWQDYIFSDRLTLDDSSVEAHNLPQRLKGKTFAEASKRLNKSLKERPNDPIARNTTDAYMSHLQMANDEKIAAEEASNIKKFGGHIYDGLSEPSGFLNLEDPRILDRFLYDQDPMSKMKELPSFGNQKLESSKLIKKAKDIEGLGLDAKTDLGSNYDFLSDPKNLRYAPVAFNALAGIFSKTPSLKKISPTLIKKQGMLSPGQIDEQSLRAGIDSAYRTQASDIAEASGGSGSALRASLLGSQDEYLNSIGQSFLEANKANLASKMAADQFNIQTAGNIDAQNASLLNRANEANIQAENARRLANYENRMSYLGQATEDLGNIGKEERFAELMPRIYGYNKSGQYVKDNRCGGKIRIRKNTKK